MGIFFQDPNEEEPLVIEHGDEMDTETKILVVKSISLLESTRKEWHRRGVGIDMTLRMQLKQDCREMEKAIRAVDSRMQSKEKTAKLQNIYERLKAEAEAVLNIHSE